MVGPTGSGATPTVRELEKITSRTDTRDVLAHASKSARKLNDYFIVDIDAHVTETAFWSEITDRIDNDYLRHAALSFRERGGSPPGLLNVQPGMLYQDMFGRIPHGQQADAVIGEGTHRQVELVRRAMDSMGIDYTVAFPTPMLLLGMHPNEETPARTPWWLLLLRLVAAALVILALARPVLDSAGSLVGGGPVLLVIDNGWSAAADWPRRMRRAS